MVLVSSDHSYGAAERHRDDGDGGDGDDDDDAVDGQIGQRILRPWPPNVAARSRSSCVVPNHHPHRLRCFERPLPPPSPADGSCNGQDISEVSIDRK